MSAASIQKKINNAHKKVGQALGETYTIYRPLYNTDVLDESNVIDDVKLTCTLSDSYTTALAWQVPVWTAYTATALIESGDFLYSELLGRTFFVLNKLPHLPILMVEVNDRIDVKSVGYGNDGTGYAPNTITYVARNLPCYKSFAAGSISSNIPANNVASAGVRRMTVITTLPKTLNLMGHSIVGVDGFVGDVIQYDFSSIGSGVRFEAQEFQVTA